MGEYRKLISNAVSKILSVNSQKYTGCRIKKSIASRIIEYNKTPDSIEVSYELNPIFWGKGYATEIVERSIQYAFEELNLKKIIVETQKNNKASIRVLEKLDMIFEKEVKRHDETQVIYSIQNTTY